MDSPRERTGFGGLVRPCSLGSTRITSVLLAGALTFAPVALLLSTNRGKIAAPSAVVLIGAVASIMAMALSLALRRWLPPHAAGVLAGATGYAFFTSGRAPEHLSPFLKGTPLLLTVWVALSLFLFVAILALIGDSTRVFNGAVAVTVLVVVALSVNGAPSPGAVSVEVAGSTEVRTVRTPNVYLFVLDAFGQPDVMHEQFGDLDLDISAQLDELALLGFELDEQATGNYPETILSVPSTLNAQFHHTTETPLSETEYFLDGRQVLAGRNRTVDFFRSAGYGYWHAGSGLWDAGQCDSEVADRCLGQDVSNTESRMALWETTALGKSLWQPSVDSAATPHTVVDEILRNRATGAVGPYFVFSHILLPHQPFRFDAECGPVEDGDFVGRGREGFVGQLTCVSTQVADAMAELTAADPDAIIILQGDHGTSFLDQFDDLDWSTDDQRERLSVFRSIRMPDSCRSDAEEAQSLINTMPLLVGCITGTEPDLVEPRVFITNYNNTVGGIRELSEVGGIYINE